MAAARPVCAVVRGGLEGKQADLLAPLRRGVGRLTAAQQRVAAERDDKRGRVHSPVW